MIKTILIRWIVALVVVALLIGTILGLSYIADRVLGLSSTMGTGLVLVVLVGAVIAFLTWAEEQ